MTTIKAVIHPIIGKGQYRHPLQYYLLLAVAILVDSWNFSSARFLTNPKYPPLPRSIALPLGSWHFYPICICLKFHPYLFRVWQTWLLWLRFWSASLYSSEFFICDLVLISCYYYLSNSHTFFFSIKSSTIWPHFLWTFFHFFCCLLMWRSTKSRYISGAFLKITIRC